MFLGLSPRQLEPPGFPTDFLGLNVIQVGHPVGFAAFERA